MQRYVSRVARRALLAPDISKSSLKDNTCYADRARLRKLSSPSTGYTATLFNQHQVVSALRRGERQRASTILLNLGHDNTSLSSEDFSYILEYCAKAPDPLFVIETWHLMENKKVQKNKETYRWVVKALSKGGYCKEAIDFLTSLEKESTCGLLQMFNVMLNACGNMKNLQNAEICLGEMENLFLGMSEVTYVERLKLAVLQRDLPAVYEVWNDCNAYYSPNIILLQKFIRSFSRLGRIQLAYELLQHMLRVAAKIDESFASSAKPYQHMQLDIPVPRMKEASSFSFSPGCQFLMPYPIEDKSEIICKIDSIDSQLVEKVKYSDQLFSPGSANNGNISDGTHYNELNLDDDQNGTEKADVGEVPRRCQGLCEVVF